MNPETARSFFSLALFSVVLLAAPGCGDKDGDTGDGHADSGHSDGGAETASAAWVDTEVALARSCGFGSCHAGYQAPDLTEGNSYDAIVGVEAHDAEGQILVVPGDADASYMVAKVEGAAGIEGAAMPKGSDQWTPEEIANLRAWIDAGALAE